MYPYMYLHVYNSFPISYGYCTKNTPCLLDTLAIKPFKRNEVIELINSSFVDYMYQISPHVGISMK